MNGHIYAGDDPVNFVEPDGLSLIGDLVHHYVGPCLEGAAIGAVIASWSGPGAAGAAASGCAQAAGTEFVKRHVNRDAGEALDYLGKAATARDITKIGLRRIVTRSGVRYVRILIHVQVA